MKAAEKKKSTVAPSNEDYSLSLTLNSHDNPSIATKHIIGGTPSNLAMALLATHQVQVITGPDGGKEAGCEINGYGCSG